MDLEGGVAMAVRGPREKGANKRERETASNIKRGGMVLKEVKGKRREKRRSACQEPASVFYQEYIFISHLTHGRMRVRSNDKVNKVSPP